jgi:hypothetical protein
LRAVLERFAGDAGLNAHDRNRRFALKHLRHVEID